MQMAPAPETSARRAAILGLLIAGASGLATAARADEGGISFWVPGFFGSLAAAPQQPSRMAVK
jgi:hypothetical protein